MRKWAEMTKHLFASNFALAYLRLNPNQQKVVDTIEGPMLVVAGPGTGKTEVLSLRAANILLQTDTQPQNILLLTFTDAAAKNMVRRLTKLIGSLAYQIPIKTFHSFCDEIISNHPEFFRFERDSQPISEIEQYEIFRILLSNPDLTALRTPGSKYHYIPEVSSSIATLKQEGVSPDTFENLIKVEIEKFENLKETFKKTQRIHQENLIAKHQELLSLYRTYQQELLKRKRYDFADMIMETLSVLKSNETILLEYQEQHQYLLVDEYQDTNSAQNEVVDLLASYWGQEANVCVVGDPDQTIYRFQGASLENTLGFVKRYPNALCVKLTVGYRCTQSIYEAAHALLKHNSTYELPELDRALSSTPLQSPHQGHPLSFEIFPNSTAELTSIAQQITSLQNKGTKPSDIAILCKKNSQCRMVSEILDSYGIQYNLESEHNVLENESVRQFLSLVTIISQLDETINAHTFYTLLNFEWVHLDPLLIIKITRAASQCKPKATVFDLVLRGLSAIQKLTGCEKITPFEFLPLETVCQNLSIWKREESHQNFSSWILKLAQESGFLNWLLKQSKVDIDDINTLFHQIKRWNMDDHDFHIHLFLNLLETITAHSLSIPQEPFSSTNDKVTVCTVHKAKGREWKYVYIPMFIDKNWGNERKPNALPLPEGILKETMAHSPVEDERRLLYVALTRAKTNITLSYAQTAVLKTKVRDQIPSQFMSEIPTHLLKSKEQTFTLQQITAIESKLLTPPTKVPIEEERKQWLSEVVQTFPISASSLTLYLHSPKEFYEHNILRIPQETSSGMVFGNAIHTALEYYYASQKQRGMFPSTERVLEVFSKSLEKELLSNEDRSIRQKQGENLLQTYISKTQTIPTKTLATEAIFRSTFLDDIQLTGKIDRLDILDTEKRLIRIVDYKTGHSKTLGAIEGTAGVERYSPRELSLPNSIRGTYKRQVVFYALLLSLSPAYKNFEIGEAVFEFLEAKSETEAHRIVHVTENDLRDLRELIKTVSKEIRSLSFLDEL